METTAATCRHSTASLLGLKFADVTDETVTFRCPNCGVERDMLRCAGRTWYGDRCKKPVLIRADRACRAHRQQVALAMASRGEL